MNRILLEKHDFIVIDKPAGLAMHSDESEGVIAWLRREFDDQALYPVHRLDRHTTGCLIIAKGQQANSSLSKLFRERRVEKFYWAVTDKKPSKKQGTVIGDMTRTRNGAWKLLKSYDNPATTQFFSFGLGEGLRATLLKPYTGKTHQIRVALKSLGAPIVGDERYGGTPSDRLYLHAAMLIFEYQAEVLRVECKPNEGEFFRSTKFKARYEETGDPMSLPWPNRNR